MHKRRKQKLRGAEQGRPFTPKTMTQASHLLPHSPSPFLPFLPFHLCFLPFPFISLEVHVGPHQIQLGVWRSAVSSLSGVWDRAQAEIELGAC